MTKRIEPQPLSSGVDALIERLRQEGVTAGRTEADAILAEAKAQAKQVLDKASAEAQARLESAQKEADAYRSAGEEALKTAMRDTVLDMKATLAQQFSADVKRLVSHQLQDPEVLKRMILEVAARTRDGAEVEEGDQLEVILPETVVGLQELRQNPEELREGTLTKFVFGLTGEMLRSGVTFSASDDFSSGLRVHVTEKEVTLDLTDAAVASLLLQHLQPRFRAILEGIVK